MREDQMEALVKKFYKRGEETGSLEEDLLVFGRMVVEESTRLANIAKAREICQSGGGHFFSFLTDKSPSAGEIVYENGKTIISGWRGCDVKCDHCDAWLVIKYEETT